MEIRVVCDKPTEAAPVNTHNGPNVDYLAACEMKAVCTFSPLKATVGCQDLRSVRTVCFRADMDRTET